MTEVLDIPIHKRTLEQQIEAQTLTLAEGETPVRYRDLVLCYDALCALGARHLPTKQARIHFARSIRVFKPDIEDYKGERLRIQQDHAPDPETVTADGDRVQFKDGMGMTSSFAELDAMVVAIRLPAKITDAMLPVNDKAHPNNEDGLANLVADLGPLYDIDLESAA